MDCSTPGFPNPHHLPEFAQIHVHWTGDAIQPSHPLPPFSPFAFSLCQHKGFFQWVSSLHQAAKVLELQLYISPSNEYSGLIFFWIDWFDLLAVQGILKSVVQHHSLKTSILQHPAFFMVQLLHPDMTMGKTTALTIWIFVGKAMPLLFNILSRFVRAFHRRSKRLLISWLQSPFTLILDPKKRKSVIAFTFSPSVCPEVMGLNAMIFIFWMLILHSPLSPSSSWSLVPLHFLPLEWYDLHIWGCLYFSQPYCW